MEIVTMCPTGWFVPTPDAPAYLEETMASMHPFGELRTWEGAAS